MSKLRIQKFLSEQGVTSRRSVEQMIMDGRISVNGHVVVDLPCFVEPGQDEVRVDGRTIKNRQAPKTYFLLNKPRGVVCAQSDMQGRPLASDLVPDEGKRLNCVGRLDADSTGLVILTNDGELTQYLTHARYGVSKTFAVEIEGRLNEAEMVALKGGGPAGRGKRIGVKVLRGGTKTCVLELQMAEGRTDLRMMLARLGHPVRRLKCTAIGQITDHGIKIAHFRQLRPLEIAKLKKTGQQAPPQSAKRTAKRTRK